MSEIATCIPENHQELRPEVVRLPRVQEGIEGHLQSIGPSQEVRALRWFARHRRDVVREDRSLFIQRVNGVSVSRI
jgi:hypothetical protein